MRATRPGLRVGIDTGGTFTDFVVARHGAGLETFKIRSNPSNPASVILEGLARIGGRPEVVHGSTVATNALLERKGARTALVTTAGFEDVIEIGRQNRERLYVLDPPERRVLCERELRFGVSERVTFEGEVLSAPAPEELKRLAIQLKKAGVEAVAICLLHSYANAEHERAVAAACTGLGYVCASNEISPEMREYERTSTTYLNAYVGPLMDRYLGQLSAVRQLWVMQSSGGLLRASEARAQAVRTLLSGPAGGVVGAIEVARLSGFTRVLGFDMGGTSTDVSLSEGSPRQTTEACVDGFPVRVPGLDIQTVGAGGGSIARVDAGGLLRVGPESAGAQPGPACYGTGELPTVTDANVVLGRIGSTGLLGGSMAIYPDRSAAAVDGIARALGFSRMKAAEGIVRVANANMERAIRSVSVERGYDPREFALVAFGGSGGLHACEVAESLGIETVVVPEHAGVLSALGMLLADRVRDYSAGVPGVRELEPRYRALERQARADMRGAQLMRLADARYVGQSFELTIPEGGDFHAAHEREYGYADRSRAVEVVTIRVHAVAAVEKLRVKAGTRVVTRRQQRGPAAVADYGSTAWIPAGWSWVVDEFGSLIITRV
ncbi:MAG: hydantoinase/oxoprolinase family protein [Bryobacteraceae bacterium]|nr:hydantoinase/oxoprolinase family protein [Bryobacteraceae bacterium]